MGVMGTETEYGISCPGARDLSPMLLSATVVAAHAGPATSADYDSRFLANGSRLYVDHAHPELSTPETTDPWAAVRYDLAGDEIVREAARRAGAHLGAEVRVFKNNTDGKGASYGFHENHQLRRDVAWDRIVAGFLPYVVSRLPLTGAGRVGLGQAGEEPGFQVSQRADFFEAVTGLDTTRRRPLVNTRDEPHAASDRWRRLHVIAGDANRAHTSRLLTIGTGHAVVAGIEAGVIRPVELADPLAAVRTVSRDLTCRAVVPLADGRQVTALDLQESYATQVLAWGGVDLRLVALWLDTIQALRRDVAACADRLDWVAKWQLLEHYRSRDGLGWDAPRLAQLDLQYADLDPARSVYDALVRAGRLRERVPASEVATAVVEPPADTRAFLRGRLVRDHAAGLLAVDWATVILRRRSGRVETVRLDDPARYTRAEVGDLVESGAELDAVIERLPR